MKIQIGRKPAPVTRINTESPNISRALVAPKSAGALGVPARGDIVTSISEINELLNCGQKWGWKHVARLGPHGVIQPLFMGSLIHFALDQFYRGQPPENIRRLMDSHYRTMLKEFGHMSPEDREETDVQAATATGMMEGYRKIYPPAKDFQVIASEYPFMLPVGRAPIPGTAPVLTKALWFTGIIDLVVWFRGSLWVVEHKTASQINKNYLDRLELDYQITGMLWALRKLIDLGIIRNKDGTKPQVKGVVYNVIRKPQIRQKKKQTRDAFIKEIESLYVERASEHFHRQEFFRGPKVIDAFTGMLLRTAGIKMYYQGFELEELPRNTFACTAKGTCEFLPLCVRGRDRITMMLYKEREPHQLQDTNQPLILE